MPGPAFPKRLRYIILAWIVLGLPALALAQPPLVFDLFPKRSFALPAIADPTLRVLVEPEPVKTGSDFKLRLFLELAEGWHIYSLRPLENSVEMATKIDLVSPPFSFASSTWTESTPHLMQDEALEKLVQVHSGRTEFHRKLHVPGDLQPGAYPLEGSIIYRACNNLVCMMPKELPFQAKILVHPRG